MIYRIFYNFPPLYSIPHLSLTMMGLPVSPLRKGFGLSGRALDMTVYIRARERNRLEI